MNNRSENAASKTNVSVAGQAKASGSSAGIAGSSPPPKNWEEIDIGSVVIAHESPEDGWWEAVVTQITGDMLTLRWRDYPRHAAIAQERHQVALIFPGK